MKKLSVQQVIRRFDKAKSKRREIEPYWTDAYDNTYPLRGERIGQDVLSDIDVQGGARDKQARIYDGTLRNAARQLASAILSGLTPSNSRWFGQEIFGVQEQEGKKWLEASADVIWQNIHNANYDITAFEGFLDYVLAGMFALYIEPGDFEKGILYSFQLWPLHGCYFADSTGKGRVDMVYRNFTLTAEQAIAEYGENKVGVEIRDAAENKPDQLFEFVQCIYPRGRDRKATELPIASIHIALKTKKTVRELGYHEMPVIVPRWMPIPGSVYSVGPADDALPDHKTLNQVVEMVLQNADMAIAGMWGVVNDGVINPKTITVGPRKIIVVESKDSIFPLRSGAQFDVAQLEIQRLQQAVRHILMSDQLNPETGPQMTATEIHKRQQIVRQLLGPMYSRLQAEFLVPLVERCFGIAVRTPGVLDAPPQSIQDKISRLTYKSPMARAQKLEDVVAMERHEAGLFNAAKVKPDVLDTYDFDAAEILRAELLGVPAKLVRDEKGVKKIRDDRARAQQEAANMQHQQEMQKLQTQNDSKVQGAIERAKAQQQQAA